MGLGDPELDFGCSHRPSVPVKHPLYQGFKGLPMNIIHPLVFLQGLKTLLLLQ